MGHSTIGSDALSRAVTYDVTEPIHAGDRRIHREISNSLNGTEYQNATLNSVAEVQSITTGDRTGGTMDLSCFVSSGLIAFTVLNLAWNATAAATQIAVDAAAVAADPDYIIGDIVLANGPFGTGGAATLFAFSGDTVRGDHPLIVIDGTNLTGGTVDPVPSELVQGIVPRFWFAALKAMGVIKGTDPAFEAAPSGQYTVNLRDSLENYPSNQTIRALIKEATVQESQDWETELLPLLGLDVVASGVQV